MSTKKSLAIRTREQIEQLEEASLRPYATVSAGAHSTRRFEEPEHAYRTAFQRDRDRIIHCRAFRRLKHKRQVFLTTEGDHYRTRITHTLEVSQLSRTMSRVLGLNEDLVEAIALGHDLGHTPFGHLGERILHEIMSGKRLLAGQKRNLNLGGFKHNYQSLRIIDELERKYPFDGLNLTVQVREGVLKHTLLLRERIRFPDINYNGLRFETDTASTLEGQVVAICDEIAQRTHDLEDGLRASLVDPAEIRDLQIVGRVEQELNLADLFEEDKSLYSATVIRGLINLLVDDVVKNSLNNLADLEPGAGRSGDFDVEVVRFSTDLDPLQKDLNKFIYREIIDNSRESWSDDLGEKLIVRLFQAYHSDPSLLPRYLLDRSLHEHAQSSKENQQSQAGELGSLPQTDKFWRPICDHIAGMTDHYALREAERLALLGKITIRDLKLELAFGNRF